MFYKVYRGRNTVIVQETESRCFTITTEDAMYLCKGYSGLMGKVKDKCPRILNQLEDDLTEYLLLGE